MCHFWSSPHSLGSLSYCCALELCLQRRWTAGRFWERHRAAGFVFLLTPRQQVATASQHACILLFPTSSSCPTTHGSRRLGRSRPPASPPLPSMRGALACSQKPKNWSRGAGSLLESEAGRRDGERTLSRAGICPLLIRVHIRILQEASKVLQPLCKANTHGAVLSGGSILRLPTGFFPLQPHLSAIKKIPPTGGGWGRGENQAPPKGPRSAPKAKSFVLGLELCQFYTWQGDSVLMAYLHSLRKTFPEGFIGTVVCEAILTVLYIKQFNILT